MVWSNKNSLTNILYLAVGVWVAQHHATNYSPPLHGLPFLGGSLLASFALWRWTTKSG